MNKRFRTSIVTLALVVASPFISTVATTTRAQAPAVAKPDISGSWKLNVAQSSFSPAPQPSAQTEVITLAGDNLTIDYATTGDDGKQKYLYNLKIGGEDTPLKPTLNETPLVLVR